MRVVGSRYSGVNVSDDSYSSRPGLDRGAMLADIQSWEAWKRLEARLAAAEAKAIDAATLAAIADGRWKWPQRIASGAMGLALAAAAYVWAYAKDIGDGEATMRARDAQIVENRRGIERTSSEVRALEREVSLLSGRLLFLIGTSPAKVEP